MAVGKQRADWYRTSEMLALTANCNRRKGKKRFSAEDFIPYSLRDVPEPLSEAARAAASQQLFSGFSHKKNKN